METDIEPWLNYMILAASSERMVDLFCSVTNLPRPETAQNYDREVLMAPPPVLRDYLYWVTVSDWGPEGVPEDFWLPARVRWPKVRLPKHF